MHLYSQIRGANFRPAEAKAALAEISEGDYLRLEAEPTNPYDPNAVACFYTDSRGEEHHVGYVARQNNGPVAQALADGIELICTVIDLATPKKPGILIEEIPV